MHRDQKEKIKTKRFRDKQKDEKITSEYWDRLIYQKRHSETYNQKNKPRQRDNKEYERKAEI